MSHLPIDMIDPARELCLAAGRRMEPPLAVGAPVVRACCDAPTGQEQWLWAPSTALERWIA